MLSARTSRWLLVLSGILTLAFTIWLIHEANIGRDNALFKLVRATPYGDKIGHILLAGILTLIANYFLKNRVWRVARVPLPVGSLIVVAILALEEASQYYLPTRSLDIIDALANLAGIALFSIPALVFRRRTNPPVG